jgi:hypothetical protein
MTESSQPNDRMAEIRAAAEQIVKETSGYLIVADDMVPEEIETAMQEAHDLAARICDLAGDS